MAFAFIPPRALAMQEGLRSYIVYDQLPIGCAAFQIVEDSCEPHVQKKYEWVAVDTEDPEQMTGELFLIRGVSSGRRTVRELVLRDGQFEAVWWVHSCNRPRTLEVRPSRIRTGLIGPDGPYAADGERAAYFQRKIIGTVTGIMGCHFCSEHG